MRIDLNPTSMPELEKSRGASTANVNSGRDVESAAHSDDVASLSTGHDAISSLGAQMNAVPDIRQELVASLRQAILSGTYRVSPADIADKMISDRVG